MSDKPATSPLLSADELDSIRALHKSAHAKGMPFDSYADAIETIGALLAHLDATRQVVAEQLRGLLLPVSTEGVFKTKAATYDARPFDEMEAKGHNAVIRAIAHALHINLLP